MRPILVGLVLAVLSAGLFSPFFGIGAPAANTAFAQQQNATQGQTPTQGQSACSAGQNASGATSAATAGNQSSSSSGTTGAMNTTTAGGESGGQMQALSDAKMRLQEACTALQGNDVPGALLKLVILEKLLGNIEGNMTSTAGADNATGQQQNQSGFSNPLDALGDLFGGGR